MATATFTIDSAFSIPFTINAYIVGDRWRHDLTNDHFGDLSSLQVVSEQYFGPYPPGTPLHYILEYLVNRIIELESRAKGFGNFGVNAYLLDLGGTVESGGTVRGALGIDAVKWSYIGGKNFKIDGVFAFSFSMDAAIRFEGAIYLDAVVV